MSENINTSENGILSEINENINFLSDELKERKLDLENVSFYCYYSITYHIVE